MSRPIYEPSDQRTAARLNYGQEQLFRRPAPQTSGGVEVAHLFAWNYDTDNEIPDQTWTSVTSIGGGLDGFYQEVFYTPEFSVAWDCDTGVISLPTAGEYLIQGWVQFNEDAVDGEQRFIGINFGGGNRHVQEYVANANSLGNLTEHLPVHSFYLRTLISSVSCFLEAWQDSGGPISVNGAEFSVKRLVAYTDGTDEVCMT